MFLTPEHTFDLLWLSIGTAGSLAFLALCVSWIRSWMSENEDPTAPAHELLAQYREMHDRGELTDEEFRFIKGQLVASIVAMPRSLSNGSQLEKNPRAGAPTETTDAPVAGRTDRPIDQKFTSVGTIPANDETLRGESCH